MISALTFKARMILLAVAAVFLIGLGATVGATAQYWRLNSKLGDERVDHAKAIADLTKTITEQQQQIQLQDQATAILQAQANSADEARKLAELRVQEMAEISRSRIDKITAMSAKDCADVLAQYWELRR